MLKRHDIVNRHKKTTTINSVLGSRDVLSNGESNENNNKVGAQVTYNKDKEVKVNVEKKEDELIGDSKKSSSQKSKDSYGILKDSGDKSKDNNDNKNAEENENEKDN